MLIKKFFFQSLFIFLANGRSLHQNISEVHASQHEWFYQFKSANVTTNDTESQDGSRRDKRSLHVNMESEGITKVWPNGVIPYRISQYFDRMMVNAIESAIQYIETVSQKKYLAIC